MTFMYSILRRAIGGVPTVHRMMTHESRIRLDLRKADLRTTLTVILCLMISGFDTASAFHRYLAKRGCPFDREEIEFLLDMFEGGDPDFHLWQRHDLVDRQACYGLLHTCQELLTKSNW